MYCTQNKSLKSGILIQKGLAKNFDLSKNSGYFSRTMNERKPWGKKQIK